MRFFGIEIEPSIKRSDPGFSDSYYTSSLAMLPTSSGQIVTPISAMRLAGVYACVKVMSETIGSLPLKLYRRKGNDERELASDHHLSSLFGNRPNNWMTRQDWIQMQVRHLLLRGNAFNQVVFSGRGKLEQIVPLHPDFLKIEVKEKNEIEYIYSTKAGPHRFSFSEILHFKGSSEDGITGLSPISEVRDIFGNALAQESFQASFFKNGTRLSGVLQSPEELDDDAHARMQQSWSGAYAGPVNAGKVAVLEQGTTFKEISMTAQDAQYIEQKKFSLGDIARVFRVPPPMIGDLDRATYTNIENLMISFVVYTLHPWLTCIEQAIARDILRPLKMEDEYYVEFMIDALLRGDFEKRMKGFQIGLQNGIYSINEVRKKLNENAVKGGDAHFFQANNYAPIDMIGEVFLSNNAKKKSKDQEDEEDSSKDESQSESESDDNERIIDLLADAFGRIKRKQANACARALNRKDFDSWSDEFFFNHAKDVYDVLRPCIRAFNMVDDQALLSFVALYNTEQRDMLRRDNYENVIEDWRSVESARADAIFLIQQLINTETSKAHVNGKVSSQNAITR